MADKKADLAGPGIGNYDDLRQELSWCGTRLPNGAMS